MVALLHRALPLCLAFLRKNKHYLLAFLWIGAIALAFAFSLTALGTLAAILFGIFALGCVLRIYKRFTALLLLIPLFISLAFSLVYAHRLPEGALLAYEGKQGYAVLTITDISSSGDGELTAEASLSSLGDKDATGRILLYLSTKEDFKEGDTLRVYVSAISEISGSYAAEGLHAVFSANGAVKLGERHTLRSIAARYNAYLSSLLRARVSGEEGDLLSALLLGDKDGLSSSLSLVMSRCGTSHILALSGLHLSLFVFGVSLLLRRLHKKVQTVILLCLIAGYILLTGASPSVLRAGFMCFCALLSFLVGRYHNGLFSLFVSVCLILVLAPYAVFSLSLWLSALATLGILLFYSRHKQETEETEKKKKSLALRALLFLKNYLLLSSVITAAASLMTLPLAASLFGSYSLLSVPANLLLSPLVYLLLYGAILVLLLGFISPLSFLVKGVASLFLFIAARLSSIPHTQISLSGPIAVFLAFLFPLLILGYYLFVPKKRFRKKRVLSLVLALALSFSLLHIGDFYLHRNGESLEFASSPSLEYDAVCLKESTKTFLVDGSLFGAGSMRFALSLAEECKRQEIDGYVITQYGTELLSALRALANEAIVREIYLPYPKTTTEAQAAEALLADQEALGLPVVFYEVDEALTLGKATFTLLFRQSEDGIENALFYSLQMGRREALYASASCFAQGTAYTLLAKQANSCDTLLIGSYGQRGVFLPLSSVLRDGKDIISATTSMLPSGSTLEATKRGSRCFFAPSVRILS